MSGIFLFACPIWKPTNALKRAQIKKEKPTYWSIETSQLVDAFNSENESSSILAKG